jgi:hypothetical protein
MENMAVYIGSDGKWRIFILEPIFEILLKWPAPEK